MPAYEVTTAPWMSAALGATEAVDDLCSRALSMLGWTSFDEVSMARAVDEALFMAPEDAQVESDHFVVTIPETWFHKGGALLSWRVAIAVEPSRRGRGAGLLVPLTDRVPSSFGSFLTVSPPMLDTPPGEPRRDVVAIEVAPGRYDNHHALVLMPHGRAMPGEVTPRTTQRRVVVLPGIGQRFPSSELRHVVVDEEQPPEPIVVVPAVRAFLLVPRARTTHVETETRGRQL